MTPPPWKVGELAGRTGMSVRALHHYDEIGLLVPRLRTPSGHRLYDRADVERLQQIQSLRLMGIALDEIRRLLDGAALSARQVIEMHLARLQEQIAEQTRLAERLTTLARYLDETEHVTVDELCRRIEATTKMEQYFTPEQLAVLTERRTAVGAERAQQVRAEWAEIIPKVRTAIDGGVDPTAPEILAIARRWRALVHEFTGGDPAIARAVQTMYEHEAPTIQRVHGPVPTPDMFPYMARAFAALEE